MKRLKITSSILMLFLVLHTSAQETANQMGVMNATTTYTFGYEKDDVTMPYTVNIRESRVSTAKFDQEDMGKVNQDRIPTPEHVAMLIEIKIPNSPSDNRVLSLRYKKNVNDTFNIKPTSKGFVIMINEREIHYNIGDGVSFNSASDKDYFSIDEFDGVE